MTKSLVTGGAGAIGSRLVNFLCTMGHDVYVLDDLSSGFRELIHPDATFIHSSVTDASSVLNVLRIKFNYIFHLAALFANQNSVDHPFEDLQTNGRGTLCILDAVAQSANALPLKRFVYASSSCVYGASTGQIDEDTAFRPDTPYAITKLLGEQYVRYFHEMHSIPTTTLRLFNSYGPGEKPGKYRNVIPNFIRLALLHEPLTITGTGEETRDFTFVSDVVRGFWSAACSEKSIGREYNIGTGQPTAIGDIASHIIRLTDSKSELRYQPRRDWDHVAHRCAAIDRARRDLEFEPATTIENGLRETVSWIRSLPSF